MCGLHFMRLGDRMNGERGRSYGDLNVDAEFFDARFSNRRPDSHISASRARPRAGGWPGWRQSGVRSQHVDDATKPVCWFRRFCRSPFVGSCRRLRGFCHARTGRASGCTDHASTGRDGFGLRRRSSGACRSVESHPAGPELVPNVRLGAGERGRLRSLSVGPNARYVIVRTLSRASTVPAAPDSTFP
jgi:hypothetical protein